MVRFVVIAATDMEMGIGKDGSIPWKLPQELAFFKEVTTRTEDPNKQNVVIMGRKTWESLPEKYRPLPNRMNLILTRDVDWGFQTQDIDYPDKCWCLTSLEDALDLAETPDTETVFVIGGGEVYKEALAHPDCHLLILSQIPEVYECDTFLQIPERFEVVTRQPQVEFDVFWLMPKEDS